MQGRVGRRASSKSERCLLFSSRNLALTGHFLLCRVSSSWYERCRFVYCPSQPNQCTPPAVNIQKVLCCPAAQAPRICECGTENRLMQGNLRGRSLLKLSALVGQTLLYTIFALLSGMPVFAQSGTIALVQHASKDAGSSTSSTLAFGANNTAGNWIAVCDYSGGLRGVGIG